MRLWRGSNLTIGELGRAVALMRQAFLVDLHESSIAFGEEEEEEEDGDAEQSEEDKDGDRDGEEETAADVAAAVYVSEDEEMGIGMNRNESAAWAAIVGDGAHLKDGQLWYLVAQVPSASGARVARGRERREGGRGCVRWVKT